MPNIWLASDHHFSHQNEHGGIIALCNRPFASIEEMDCAIIARHNEVVKPRDTVYLLGDFAWKNHNKYLSALNGEKILILGSHDKMPQSILRNFTDVVGTAKQPGTLCTTIDKKYVVFAHHPYDSWPASFHGSWHAHGHTHCRMKERIDRLRHDVGVDGHNFCPWEWSEWAALMSEREKAWRECWRERNAEPRQYRENEPKL